MSNWKAIAGFVAVAAVLWWLYPSRQLGQEAGPEVVEVFFMGPGGTQRDKLMDLLREFERLSEEAHGRDANHPVYRVVFGQSAARNQVEDPTRFLVSAAGGMPPDVIHFDRYAVAEWAGRGGFEPLDEYIQRDLADIASGRRKDIAPQDVPTRDRFFKACWNEGMYKGKVYGIPNSVDNRALYYNKDLLIAAGYKTIGPDGEVRARPPKTWEELAEYAVKLTQHDEKGRIKVIGFPAYYGNSWLYMYGWMNGAKFMSDDRRTCTLNAPRIVEALEYLKRVYDLQGGYPKVRAFEAGFQGNELDPFIQGKIAMKIDGVWVMERHASYGRDLNFGVAPNPMPQKRIDELTAAGETAAISWSGGWAYAIPSTAKNKRAAWEFIRFLTSDRAFRIGAENDRILAESQGRLYVPNQCPVKKLNDEFYEKYVLRNDRLPQRFKEAYKVFNDLLPYSKFRPVT
ncbi:MAG: extracellular solute-binding protein, partial [Phycisphaerae bacterium]